MADSISMMSVITPQKRGEVKSDLAASSLGLDSYWLTPCASGDASSLGGERRERARARSGGCVAEVEPVRRRTHADLARNWLVGVPAAHGCSLSYLRRENR